jgi:hypothetical protein
VSGAWARRLLLPALLVLAAGAAAADPSPRATAAAEAEIERLISSLEGSGCEFERNGRWYDAARATAHLRRKYDWLRRRDLVPTAELFIERAASRSSRSGQAYRVRCPADAVEPSATWFGRRLQEIRRPPPSQAPQ